MTPARNPHAATAEAQLDRILHILPAAARGRGIAIDELAHSLGVEPAVILQDIREATARAFHHPGGFVEPFSIRIEGRRVRVEHLSEDFRRPVQLNAREALALGLGLRALATDSQGERRSRILALAARLERELTTAADPSMPPRRAEGTHTHEASVEYDDDTDIALALRDDGFRGVVADAIDAARTCRIVYLRPGEAAPTERVVAPWRLIYAEGVWYLLASDTGRDGLRFFRLDRVLAADLLDTPAPPQPPELDGFLARGQPFVFNDDVLVSVRYSARIARWIAERTGSTVSRDGSLVLEHRVADRRWFVRHVLQYGTDAQVLAPAEARAWVAAAARSVASALTPAGPAAG